MLYSEDESEEYFGYNSMMTVEGKRVRRLRRTEVSSEKLATMRCKSPLNSSTAAKPARLRDSKSSDFTAPLAHSRSRLSIKCVTLLQHGFCR
jgi:hypothetical protein